MRGRHCGRIRSFGRSNLDQGCAHDAIKASQRALFKLYR
jgi:hypothetical protein